MRLPGEGFQSRQDNLFVGVKIIYSILYKGIFLIEMILQFNAQTGRDRKYCFVHKNVKLTGVCLLVLQPAVVCQGWELSR